MTTWILAVLALWVAQTMLPPTTRYLAAPGPRSDAVFNALGPRDTPPPMPQTGERLERARRNLLEALPVFLGLALLLDGRSELPSGAHYGAAIFLTARILYVPAYVSGVPGLRSALWIGSWVGLGMLAQVVIQG